MLRLPRKFDSDSYVNVRSDLPCASPSCLLCAENSSAVGQRTPVANQHTGTLGHISLPSAELLNKCPDILADAYFCSRELLLSRNELRRCTALHKKSNSSLGTQINAAERKKALQLLQSSRSTNHRVHLHEDCFSADVAKTQQQLKKALSLLRQAARPSSRTAGEGISSATSRYLSLQAAATGAAARQAGGSAAAGLVGVRGRWLTPAGPSKAAAAAGSAGGGRGTGAGASQRASSAPVPGDGGAGTSAADLLDSLFEGAGDAEAAGSVVSGSTGSGRGGAAGAGRDREACYALDMGRLGLVKRSSSSGSSNSSPSQASGAAAMTAVPAGEASPVRGGGRAAAPASGVTALRPVQFGVSALVLQRLESAQSTGTTTSSGVSSQPIGAATAHAPSSSSSFSSSSSSSSSAVAASGEAFFAADLMVPIAAASAATASLESPFSSGSCLGPLPGLDRTALVPQRHSSTSSTSGGGAGGLGSSLHRAGSGNSLSLPSLAGHSSALLMHTESDDPSSLALLDDLLAETGQAHGNAGPSLAAGLGLASTMLEGGLGFSGTHSGSVSSPPRGAAFTTGGMGGQLPGTSSSLSPSPASRKGSSKHVKQTGMSSSFYFPIAAAAGQGCAQQATGGGDHSFPLPVEQLFSSCWDTLIPLLASAAAYAQHQKKASRKLQKALAARGMPVQEKEKLQQMAASSTGSSAVIMLLLDDELPATAAAADASAAPPMDRQAACKSIMRQLLLSCPSCPLLELEEALPAVELSLRRSLQLPEEPLVTSSAGYLSSPAAATSFSGLVLGRGGAAGKETGAGNAANSPSLGGKHVAAAKGALGRPASAHTSLSSAGAAALAGAGTSSTPSQTAAASVSFPSSASASAIAVTDAAADEAADELEDLDLFGGGDGDAGEDVFTSAARLPKQPPAATAAAPAPVPATQAISAAAEEQEEDLEDLQLWGEDGSIFTEKREQGKPAAAAATATAATAKAAADSAPAAGNAGPSSSSPSVPAGGLTTPVLRRPADVLASGGGLCILYFSEYLRLVAPLVERLEAEAVTAGTAAGLLKRQLAESTSRYDKAVTVSNAGKGVTGGGAAAAGSAAGASSVSVSVWGGAPRSQALFERYLALKQAEREGLQRLLALSTAGRSAAATAKQQLEDSADRQRREVLAAEEGPAEANGTQTMPQAHLQRPEQAVIALHGHRAPASGSGSLQGEGGSAAGASSGRSRESLLHRMKKGRTDYYPAHLQNSALLQLLRSWEGAAGVTGELAGSGMLQGYKLLRASVHCRRGNPFAARLKVKHGTSSSALRQQQQQQQGGGAAGGQGGPMEAGALSDVLDSHLGPSTPSATGAGEATGAAAGGPPTLLEVDSRLALNRAMDGDEVLVAVPRGGMRASSGIGSGAGGRESKEGFGSSILPRLRSAGEEDASKEDRAPGLGAPAAGGEGEEEQQVQVVAILRRRPRPIICTVPILELEKLLPTAQNAGGQQEEGSSSSGQLPTGEEATPGALLQSLLPQKKGSSKAGSSSSSSSPSSTLPSSSPEQLLQRLQQQLQSASAPESILVIPTDPRLPKIRIRTRQLASLLGYRILVQVGDWPADSFYPRGHYVGTVGKALDLDTEVRCVMLETGVERHARPFPSAALACLPVLPRSYSRWTMAGDRLQRVLRAFGSSSSTAVALPGLGVGVGVGAQRMGRLPLWQALLQQWATGAAQERRDLRWTHRICSVDPPGCTDIDDALSVRVLANGNLEVGVHIADVTHFVKEGGDLDSEAKARATTVYLVDRRLDMLPTLLSENVCSLRARVDRYAMSVLWELQPCFKSKQREQQWRQAVRSSGERARREEQSAAAAASLPPAAQAAFTSALSSAAAGEDALALQVLSDAAAAEEISSFSFVPGGIWAGKTAIHSTHALTYYQARDMIAGLHADGSARGAAAEVQLQQEQEKLQGRVLQQLQALAAGDAALSKPWLAGFQQLAESAAPPSTVLSAAAEVTAAAAARTPTLSPGSLTPAETLLQALDPAACSPTARGAMLRQALLYSQDPAEGGSCGAPVHCLDEPELAKRLRLLTSVAHWLHERRGATGALEFDSTEVRFKLSSAGGKQAEREGGGELAAAGPPGELGQSQAVPSASSSPSSAPAADGGPSLSLSVEPVALELKKQEDINNTIAELMILANETVAKVTYAAYPEASLQRNHARAEDSRFKELQQLVQSAGYKLDTSSNGALARSLQHILTDLGRKAASGASGGSSGEDGLGALQTALLRAVTLRAMTRAQYLCSSLGGGDATGASSSGGEAGGVSGQPAGSLLSQATAGGAFLQAVMEVTADSSLSHYGLGLNLYTHFTSPIRRYADDVVHRLLTAALNVRMEEQLLQEWTAKEVGSKEGREGGEPGEAAAARGKQLHLPASAISSIFNLTDTRLGNRKAGPTVASFLPQGWGEEGGAQPTASSATAAAHGQRVASGPAGAGFARPAAPPASTLAAVDNFPALSAGSAHTANAPAAAAAAAPAPANAASQEGEEEEGFLDDLLGDAETEKDQQESSNATESSEGKGLWAVMAAKPAVVKSEEEEWPELPPSAAALAAAQSTAAEEGTEGEGEQKVQEEKTETAEPSSGPSAQQQVQQTLEKAAAPPAPSWQPLLILQGASMTPGQLAGIADHLNDRNQAAKEAGMECDALFLALFFRNRVELAEAVVNEVQEGGFLDVYIPTYSFGCRLPLMARAGGREGDMRLCMPAALLQQASTAAAAAAAPSALPIDQQTAVPRSVTGILRKLPSDCSAKLLQEGAVRTFLALPGEQGPAASQQQEGLREAVDLMEEVVVPAAGSGAALPGLKRRLQVEVSSQGSSPSTPALHCQFQPLQSVLVAISCEYDLLHSRRPPLSVELLAPTPTVLELLRKQKEGSMKPAPAAAAAAVPASTAGGKGAAPKGAAAAAAAAAGGAEVATPTAASKTKGSSAAVGGGSGSSRSTSAPAAAASATKSTVSASISSGSSTPPRLPWSGKPTYVLGSTVLQEEPAVAFILLSCRKARPEAGAGAGGRRTASASSIAGGAATSASGTAGKGAQRAGTSKSVAATVAASSAAGKKAGASAGGAGGGGGGGGRGASAPVKVEKIVPSRLRFGGYSPPQLLPHQMMQLRTGGGWSTGSAFSGMEGFSSYSGYGGTSATALAAMIGSQQSPEDGWEEEEEPQVYETLGGPAGAPVMLRSDYEALTGESRYGSKSGFGMAGGELSNSYNALLTVEKTARDRMMRLAAEKRHDKLDKAKKQGK